ncbi:type II TA system antitoxin MqsA family protein [Ensifer sp. 4252]|uniref:type II TA system antitoxin MqsA family protein n=1 Tax=Ensifer sp. 4252 TaxID=3373915 RepID=UPI003D225FC8
MECSYCGADALVRDTRNISYDYRGDSVLIENVTGRFCGQCNEVVPDDADGRRVVRTMLEFKRKVDLEHVDPCFIVTVRRKLKLGQREAAEVFGVGVNAFSSFETGRSKPSVPLVKLLCILDRHPDLLSEVRAACPVLPAE